VPIAAVKSVPSAIKLAPASTAASSKASTFDSPISAQVVHLQRWLFNAKREPSHSPQFRSFLKNVLEAVNGLSGSSGQSVASAKNLVHASHSRSSGDDSELLDIEIPEGQLSLLQKRSTISLESKHSAHKSLLLTALCAVPKGAVFKKGIGWQEEPGSGRIFGALALKSLHC
jgi:hypothetical protein